MKLVPYTYGSPRLKNPSMLAPSLFSQMLQAGVRKLGKINYPLQRVEYVFNIMAERKALLLRQELRGRATVQLAAF